MSEGGGKLSKNMGSSMVNSGNGVGGGKCDMIAIYAMIPSFS